MSKTTNEWNHWGNIWRCPLLSNWETKNLNRRKERITLRTFVNMINGWCRFPSTIYRFDGVEKYDPKSSTDSSLEVSKEPLYIHLSDWHIGLKRLNYDYNIIRPSIQFQTKPITQTQLCMSNALQKWQTSHKCPKIKKIICVWISFTELK